MTLNLHFLITKKELGEARDMAEGGLISQWDNRSATLGKTILEAESAEDENSIMKSVTLYVLNLEN